MKKMTIILMTLFLCLSAQGKVFADVACDTSNPNFTLIQWIGGTFSLAPIEVIWSGPSPHLKTSVTDYNPKEVAPGVNILSPTTMDYVSCTIYNDQNPPGEMAKCTYVPPPAFTNDEPLFVNEFGEWLIYPRMYFASGRYNLKCKLIGHTNVITGDACTMHRYYESTGEQSFTIEERLEASLPPVISDVSVTEHGESFTLTITGNNFGSKYGASSIFLRAGRRSLLVTGTPTITSWKNTQITCEVGKNPSANATARRRVYRIQIDNGVGKVKHSFRYPPRS